MAYRTLEITNLSAQGLKDVRHFGRLKVYALVSLPGDPQPEKRTPTDRVRERNPSWNSTFQLNVPADNPGRLALRFLLCTERSLGDRVVGEVNVPVKDLLDNAGNGNGQVQSVSCQVYVPSYGEHQGVLNFCYKVGKRVVPPEAIPTFVHETTHVVTNRIIPGPPRRKKVVGLPPDTTRPANTGRAYP